MAKNCTGVYITGTDTGCGKTHVTIAVIEDLKRRGMRVSGMKPIASGCEVSEGRLVNEDACKIRAASAGFPDYERVNPWALRDPVSPNVAASRQGLRIVPAPVIEAYRSLENTSEAIIVEGIGGWRVPLSDDFQQRDLARLLEIPVFLVVGLRLGCISHARLTAEAVHNDGIPLRGWVANHVDPEYEAVRETLEYLQSVIDAPMIGEFPYQPIGEAVNSDAALDLSSLLQNNAISP